MATHSACAAGGTFLGTASASVAHLAGTHAPIAAGPCFQPQPGGYYFCDCCTHTSCQASVQSAVPPAAAALHKACAAMSMAAHCKAMTRGRGLSWAVIPASSLGTLPLLGQLELGWGVQKVHAHQACGQQWTAAERSNNAMSNRLWHAWLQMPMCIGIMPMMPEAGVRDARHTHTSTSLLQSMWDASMPTACTACYGGRMHVTHLTRKRR
jgi:hypothetical protein